jgi:hypothetical protein
MDRKILFALIFFVMISGVIAATYTPIERNLIKECKFDCRDEKNINRNEINEKYKECREGCSIISDLCEDGAELEYDLCIDECDGISECKRICSRELREDKRECSDRECKRDCSVSKKENNKIVNDNYYGCKNNCRYTAFNSNITCEDGKYQAGEKFLEGCNKCECGYNGVSDCDLQESCNFDELISKNEVCENVGGFWGKLCKGPYFRLRCSRDNFCLCDGDFDFQCGVGNVCIHDFTVKIPSSTSGGYKDARGGELGDVGICAIKPVLPNCGNGICENVVCLNCDTAETSFNCPADCDE